MRMRTFIFGACLALSAWAPPAGAAAPNPNNFGPWPDLGPIGNGRRLWMAYNCTQCHGGAGHGGGRGPDISGGDISYDGVYNAVTRGMPYGGMPAFSQYLSPADIDNLFAYISNFGQPDQPTWVQWWAPHPKY